MHAAQLVIYGILAMYNVPIRGILQQDPNYSQLEFFFLYVLVDNISSGT